jgi:ABC-type dipeptide/oligopeptide/nickel transport system permease subunit
VFAPVISNLWGVCYNGAPGCPQNYDVLSSDGYPAVGPPFNGFTWAHPLGLEPNTGYDNLARLLYGLRTSLAIATLATVLTTVMGIAIGLVAGFARGWVDRVISFVIDLFLAFPFLLGALALAPILTSRFSQDIDKLGKAQIIGLVTVLVVFTWMGLARLIRGEVLSLREREFVQAAQVMGVPTHRILIKELLPNLTAPIIVATSLALPAFVAAEAGLSYLGIGLTSVPSLGRTIFAAVNYFENYPLYLWSPVILVMLLVVALNLLGDSIRDAFDPKTRR